MRVPLAIAATLLCSTIATAWAEDCETYVDAFNAAPDAAGAEEQLYNAGVCYEETRSLGSAIQMYEVLARTYPKAALAGPALLRLGHVYAQIAWFDEAAAKLEEYAKKYATEADAAGALDDAISYRKALGDDDRAIADTELYVKTFARGSHGAEDAANAMFSLTTVYERQGDVDKLVAHLQRYIKQYGNADAGRVVIAYAKIGEALWSQTCTSPLVDGACILVVRDPDDGGKRKFCRTYQAEVVVHKRSAKGVKAAQKALKAATSSYEKYATKGGNDPAARYYDARARLLLADEMFEAYLALALPGGLDFDPSHAPASKKSLKRFADWVSEKNALGTKAVAAYRAIFERKDVSATIAAAARLGQIPQAFARALYSAEIPKNLAKDASSTDAYCDALAEVAEPIESQSVDAFAACLQFSIDLGWFDDSSARCERELGQIDPAKYPVSSELRSGYQDPGRLTTLEPALLVLPPSDE